MKEAIGVDHITLCVKNLAATKYLFTHILGFDVIWSAQDVGSDKWRSFAWADRATWANAG